MEKLLKHSIRDECNKLIDRHYNYLFELQENTQRKTRRLGQVIPKNVLHPRYWDIHHGFNPFQVRSARHLNKYAYTLSTKLKTLTYKPCTSIIHTIPKDSGGVRELNIFQIPDATISRYVYKSLLSKNVNLFSAYTYAYREDRDAHDAILKVASDWSGRDRVYVAEFDFSKFFDRITHEYLWSVLHTHGFLYTELEEYILNAFLTSKYALADNYTLLSGEQRKVGIPQGTSVSLFLANLACWELDQEMERIGVHFARYADDTLVWSNSYDQVVRAYDAISYFSKLMGVPINFDKSEGITLISDRADEEFKSKSKVTFLGYDVSLKQVSISDKSIPRIKQRISYIIYENLLQPLKQGVYNPARLALLDWDYVTALGQIRRYLYGGLNDTKLRRFRLGVITHLRFRGLMSYYPLVDDEQQLKDLDGWLIHTLKQALRLRQKLWYSKIGISLPGPRNYWIDDIAYIKKWVNPTTNEIYDLRIPSFLQINRTMKIGLKRSGIRSVTNPKSRYYPGRATRKQFP
jgi:RNA-directed DNA polymerase